MKIEITKIFGKLYGVVIYHGNGIVEFPFEGTLAECYAFLAVNEVM